MNIDEARAVLSQEIALRQHYQEEARRLKAEIEELKKLKENAKRIKEHCEKFPICVGCSFALPNGGCVFEENAPSNWELDNIKEEW